MSRSHKSKVIKITILVLIIALLAGAVVLFKKSQAEKTGDLQTPTFTTKRGRLTISISEAGTIKARDQVIIKSEVEGKTSIISLISEGVRVKKGELLVELDASAQIDGKVDQEIVVQGAEAVFIGATEDLAVAENKAKSDIDAAILALDFAGQDLQQYIKGVYPNELKQAEGKITLAKEKLTRAQETLTSSKKLFEEKYISETELKADELSEKSMALDLDLAENNLKLLTEYTYKRTLAQLNSDLSQAKMALERVQRKARAEVIQAKATLKASDAKFKRQTEKLEKLVDQISKAKIYAPADGLVIYATSAKRASWRGSQQPLQEGQVVQERQELIYLPTASSAKVEIDIHETYLENIAVGQNAVITVDALQGKKFFGTVARIAPLPDAQSIWLNPDLKVYNSDIFIDKSTDELRTGMSCQAEVVIEQYVDATYIPVQSVIKVKGQSMVHLLDGNEFVLHPVEIGLDNGRMIRIISGIKEGDIVSLTPPLQSADVDSTDDFIQMNGSSTPKKQKSPMGQNQMPKDVADKIKNMTPEQKAKMQEAMKNMTPEQIEKMKKARKGKSGSGQGGKND